MEGTITVSPSEIVGMLLGLCAALGTLSVGITSVTKFLKWKNRPNEDQNKRLDEHDERFKKIDLKFEDYDRFLANDKNRIDAIEESGKYTQKALLALLGHAIDGNNTTQMVDARDSLQNYLINR